jgi:hypothetical protein
MRWSGILLLAGLVAMARGAGLWNYKLEVSSHHHVSTVKKHIVISTNSH